MVRYYFDTRDNEMFFEDDEGFELPSFEVAKRMASTALAEIARDVIPGAAVRTLTVELRDPVRPVLRASLHFEINRNGS